MYTTDSFTLHAIIRFKQRFWKKRDASFVGYYYTTRTIYKVIYKADSYNSNISGDKKIFRVVERFGNRESIIRFELRRCSSY